MPESPTERLQAALDRLARAERQLILFPWKEDCRKAVEELRQEVAQIRSTLDKQN
jgi:hypothetical protein